MPISGECWVETTTDATRSTFRRAVLDGNLICRQGAARGAPLFDLGKAPGEHVGHGYWGRHELRGPSQAKPNIMPWSPAPISDSASPSPVFASRDLSTPMAMSGLCSSMAVRTADL